MLSRDLLLDKCITIYDELRRLGYTEQSIDSIGIEIKAFERYILNSSKENFDESIFKEFFDFRKTQITERSFNKRKGEILKIKNWTLSDSIFGEKITIPKQDLLSESQIKDLQDFSSYLRDNNCSENAISSVLYNVVKFLIWLEQKKIDYKDFQPLTIDSYISENLAKLAPHTQQTSLSCAKRFYKFLYLHKAVNEKLFTYFPGIKNLRNIHEQALWTPDEIHRLLNAIDTSSPTGIRDYAIVMLAGHLGMRSSDIAALSFSNFDWNNNKLRFVQQKTKVENEFILTKEVGWAVINYIKIRPKPLIEDGIIFRKFRPPFLPLGRSIGKIMPAYLTRAGINHGHHLRYRGLHSLRHTLATALLIQDVPLYVISSILGHSKINSTEVYLDYDITHLRQCCIDLKEISYGRIV